MQVFHSLAELRLVELIAKGAVGVLPTDTVYGLVGSATLPPTAERVLEAKGRQYKPGTLIAANTEQFVALGIKPRYLKAVEQFWPGAVSVVLPMGPELKHLHGGALSLPVRIPNQPELLNLLKKTGPLITTSANRPNKPTAVTIAEAQAIFGDKVDFYVDGGDLSNRQPSTILRIVDDAIEIIREGAVKINEAGRIEK
jgi:L-threonylcarbamoyladenylate synthase